jgi:hypothetical protein
MGMWHVCLPGWGALPEVMKQNNKFKIANLKHLATLKDEEEENSRSWRTPEEEAVKKQNGEDKIFHWSKTRPQQQLQF